MAGPLFFDAADYDNDLHRVVYAAQDGVTAGLSGGHIWLRPGEYIIEDTLDLTRFTGSITGSGNGQSPEYASPGRGTVIRWMGPNDRPMLRVRDSRDVILERFRLQGNDVTPPTYGIEFHNNGGTTGSNEHIVVRDVSIGVYPWSTTGTNTGKVQTGLGWTGTNANNDQFEIDNVRVFSPVNHGAEILNSQSVGGVFRKFVVSTPGSAGIRTAASVHLIDPEFYGCNPDVETLAGAQTVIVDNIKSEYTKQLAKIDPNGIVSFNGGNVQCGAVIAGGQVLIDAFPSNALYLALRDLNVTQVSDPTKARLEFGPQSPYVGRFFVDVERCMGMSPSQLVLAPGASFWAWSPMSKGVVTWRSHAGNSIYQFRNELRTSGAGTRTTLNYAAWDAPVTD